MPHVLFEKSGPVAWMTLNDPECLNALTEEMGDEIRRLVAVVNRDRSIRVVVLTGAGRAFSAGGNLDIIAARTKKKGGINQREMVGFYKRFLSIREIEVPVIAMINGPAIGAAFCMTMACDFRIASSDARMGVNFVKIGLSPGMGGTLLLPQVLGIPLANDLLLTGRTITAAEALQKGIVHQVHAPETLKEETLKLANEIASNAPVAVRIAKKGISAGMRGTLTRTMSFESRGQAACFKTRDIVEGIEAIRARRRPNFLGQ